MNINYTELILSLYEMDTWTAIRAADAIEALVEERDAAVKDTKRLTWIACNAELKKYRGTPGNEKLNLKRLRDSVDSYL
jgi:hypothetical protein